MRPAHPARESRAPLAREQMPQTLWGQTLGGETLGSGGGLRKVKREQKMRIFELEEPRNLPRVSRRQGYCVTADDRLWVGTG